MKTDEELLAELKRATRGLYVMSESDYPFETLYLKGETELSLERLRQLAGADEEAHVETRGLEDFIGSTMFEAVREQDGAFEVTSGGEALARLLKNNLSELKVYRVGKINIAVFILGRSPEGNWLGLSTRVVET